MTHAFWTKMILIWISAYQLNNLHVKQAALTMKSRAENQTCFIYLQQRGFAEQPFLFFFSYPPTSFSSVTLKRHNIIKQSTNTCFYTVNPLWRPLDSTLTILKPTHRGMARSALRNTRNQRCFVGCLSTVATTTTSSILADSLLYTFDQTSRCLPATLPWNRSIANTFWLVWFPYRFCILLNPSVRYLHSINAGGLS